MSNPTPQEIERWKKANSGEPPKKILRKFQNPEYMPLEQLEARENWLRENENYRITNKQFTPLKELLKQRYKIK